MAEKKTKVKKKRWVQVLAPKLFNEQVVGETYVSDVEECMGKSVRSNLMNLTGNPKKQTVNVSFAITKNAGDQKVATEITGYQIIPAGVKRFVRRQKDKIEDSVVLSTKDGKKIRIKILFVTQGNTVRTVRTSVKKAAYLLLRDIAKEGGIDAFVEGVIYNKVQRRLKSQISKIYPLKHAEIRVIRRVEDDHAESTVPKGLDEIEQKLKEFEAKKEEKRAARESSAEPVASAPAEKTESSEASEKKE